MQGFYLAFGRNIILTYFFLLNFSVSHSFLTTSATSIKPRSLTSGFSLGNLWLYLIFIRDRGGHRISRYYVNIHICMTASNKNRTRGSGGAMWWGGGGVSWPTWLLQINNFSLCTIDFGWNIWLRSYSLTPMTLVQTFTLSHLKIILVILHNYFNKWPIWEMMLAPPLLWCPAAEVQIIIWFPLVMMNFSWFSESSLVVLVY